MFEYYNVQQCPSSDEVSYFVEMSVYETSYLKAHVCSDLRKENVRQSSHTYEHLWDETIECENVESFADSDCETNLDKEKVKVHRIL